MDQALSEKIKKFFQKYKHQTYKKGEILIRADDSPSGVFYLNDGYVKQYAISKKGDELVVNVFKPVAFFPMSWVINDTQNDYFFEAVTGVEVWRAPKDDVIAFVKDNPDVLYDLMSRVYTGVDGILTRMTYLMSGDAYTRLIAELLIYAKRFGNRQNAVEVTISEKDLAARSGMTRETVSREIKILKDKRFLALENNKIFVKDVHKLEEELAGGV